MKKFILIVFISVILLSVAGCGNTSSTNESNTDEKETNTEEPISSAKPYVSTTGDPKIYRIFYLTGVDKQVSISFDEDGTCTPLFYALNNCNPTSEFCVWYQRTDTDCTYTEENNIISIDWDGVYEVQYAYRDGLGNRNYSIIESGYIMKEIQFQYFPEEDYIDAINGEWKIEQGEGFYKVKFVLN